MGRPSSGTVLHPPRFDRLDQRRSAPSRQLSRDLTFGCLRSQARPHSAVAAHAEALIRELPHLGTQVLIAGPITSGSPSSMLATVRDLSPADVVLVEHDFGAYGGADGDEVLSVLRALDATGTIAPTSNAVGALRSICHDADLQKLRVIGYGGTVANNAWRHGLLYPNTNARVLTWGQFQPGAGVEHVIDAIAVLRRDGIDVPYTVSTHDPLAQRGDIDRYRSRLRARALAEGVDDLIVFDNTPRNELQAAAAIAAASVVALPGEASDSGALARLTQSLAAGRPVIALQKAATADLLNRGAGIAVPSSSAANWAEAIRHAALDVDSLATMTRRARGLAPSLAWSHVARQVLEVTLSMDHAGTVLPFRRTILRSRL